MRDVLWGISIVPVKFLDNVSDLYTCSRDCKARGEWIHGLLPAFVDNKSPLSCLEPRARKTWWGSRMTCAPALLTRQAGIVAGSLFAWLFFPCYRNGCRLIEYHSWMWLRCDHIRLSCSEVDRGWFATKPRHQKA